LLGELKSGGPVSKANSGAARGTAVSAAAVNSSPSQVAASAFARSSASPTAVKNMATTEVSGISVEQVAEIKAAVQAQQKFLGELVEQGSRWELDGAELRIYFPPEKRPFAEMLEGRDSLESIRSISSKVLGRTVRVCAKLEAVAAAAASASRAASGTQELRAQFERDPMVRSMLQRFGGKISEVKRRQGES
jgi:hypothetical protein